MCVPPLECLCFGVEVPSACAGLAQNAARLPPKVECPEDGCACCDGCDLAFNPCTGLCECCGGIYYTYPCVELRTPGSKEGVTGGFPNFTGGPAEEVSMTR